MNVILLASALTSDLDSKISFRPMLPRPLDQQQRHASRYAHSENFMKDHAHMPVRARPCVGTCSGELRKLVVVLDNTLSDLTDKGLLNM